MTGMIRPEIQVLTKGMHLSHVSKGYYILKVGIFYYPFYNSIMLEVHGFKEYSDCVNSFQGKI